MNENHKYSVATILVNSYSYKYSFNLFTEFFLPSPRCFPCRCTDGVMQLRVCSRACMLLGFWGRVFVVGFFRWLRYRHTRMCQSCLILNIYVVKASYFYIDISEGASMQTKQIQATQCKSLQFFWLALNQKQCFISIYPFQTEESFLHIPSSTILHE